MPEPPTLARKPKQRGKKTHKTDTRPFFFDSLGNGCFFLEASAYEENCLSNMVLWPVAAYSLFLPPSDGDIYLIGRSLHPALRALRPPNGLVPQLKLTP